MKKKITELMIFVSAGAISFGGLVARADDAQIRANNGQANTEFHGTINEPAGAELRTETSGSFGQFKKASDLIGSDVRNQQNEKVGEIKDFGVDLQSGRVPFTVVSAGGFFGVGDRMLAIPTSTFAQSSGQGMVINMDKERLKSAPSFDKNNWPAMEDRTWGSQVYSYYGQRPYWETATAETYRSSEINEPAGTGFSRSYVEENSGPFGETPSGLNPDRTPRQGLGAADLTRNEQRINNPGGYAESDSFFHNRDHTEINESAGARIETVPPGAQVYSPELEITNPYETNESGLLRDRSPRQGLGADDLTGNAAKMNNPRYYADADVFVQEPAGAERGTVRTETTTRSTTRSMQIGKVRRATDLIGMDVKNSQNERVGEIKDIVFDLPTGRVAYTVLSAGGFLGMGDRLYAVPPTAFTRGADDRTLILNVDKETLKAAPSFEKNNWPEATNQKFTSEIYQYYHQQPYWQSGQMREPSGGQQQFNRGSSGGSSGWQKGNNYEEKNSNFQEPSGANRPPQSSQQNSSKTYSDPNASAAQPENSSVEPERTQSDQPDQNKGTAAKESAELNAPQSSSSQSSTAQQSQNAPVQEPAGATTGVNATAPATGDDQAGSSADRALTQRMRAALQSDASLSSIAPNVKITAMNGKIVLHGSVSNEQEKQSIISKATEIAGGADKVESQIEVKNATDNPSTTPSPNP